jgi:DNA-binding CsgD family transcriptional regulator
MSSKTKQAGNHSVNLPIGMKTRQAKPHSKNLDGLPPIWWASIIDERMGKLTMRELAILHLLHGDRLDKEISDALGISIHTLRIHLQNTFRKLGVRGRVGAAVWWERNAWHGHSLLQLILQSIVKNA